MQPQQTTQASAPAAASKTTARRASAQPVEVATIPGALLRLSTVQAVTGLGATSIYRRLAAGTFPAPVRQGSRCTRWRSDDVRAWLAQQTPQAAA